MVVDESLSHLSAGGLLLLGGLKLPYFTSVQLFRHVIRIGADLALIVSSICWNGTCREGPAGQLQAPTSIGICITHDEGRI